MSEKINKFKRIKMVDKDEMYRLSTKIQFKPKTMKLKNENKKDMDSMFNV